MIRARSIHIPVIFAVFALGGSALPCFATVESELTSAIRHRDVQRVNTLLSEGVNVNEKDEGPEQTPLMWAVRARSAAMVQGLLRHGAAVNETDAFGNTALSLAIKSGNPQIVRLLQSHGAKNVAASAGARAGQTARVGKAGQQLARTSR